jgi:putative DNA primase/helicase
MDPRMIPESFRPWCVDIAERVWCPLEYVAASLIVVLSGLIGRRITIRPKRRDDWTVVPNLWGAVIGAPGWLKTPAVEEVCRPLKRLVADALKAHEKVKAEWEQQMLIAEARRAAAKKELGRKAKGASDEELADLARQAIEGGDEGPPPAKRYLTNDATVEKLGVLLGENPDGLIVFRDELIGFLRGFDRQGHEQDRSFFLEGWNGNGSYTVDRLGRGTLHISAICLSVFGTIQPGPLAWYLRGSISGEDADGFIPRFQLVVYPDPKGKFVNVDRWPSIEAKNAAYAIFQAIDRLDPIALGALVDVDGGLPYLRFNDDAQEFFDSWRVTLEDRLRTGTLGAVMEAHLAKYRSLMPSLALIFQLVERADKPVLGLVPREAAMAAAAWCELLEAHARRIYQAASEGNPESAMLLAERIKQSLPNPFRCRDVAKKGWTGLTTSEEVRHAVGILDDRDWVKVIDVPPGEQGGRPGELVWINPIILEGDSEQA